jgi:hypothetical protein
LVFEPFIVVWRRDGKVNVRFLYSPHSSGVVAENPAFLRNGTQVSNQGKLQCEATGFFTLGGCMKIGDARVSTTEQNLDL